MEYNRISADGHIDLKWVPHDAFVSNAPAKWKEMVPQVVDTAEGKRWFAEGKDLARLRLPGHFGGLASMELPKRGIHKRVDLFYEVGFYDGRPHPSTPELRIQDQDMDGVDADVIYGILAMGKLLEDRELLRVVYQLYNTWAADFSKYNAERLAPLACIPNDDPGAAADEVRRCAKLGLRGGDFDVSSAVRPVWHRDWDPLWAAVEECNMPLSFHTTGVPVRTPLDSQMSEEYFYQYKATQVTMFQIGGGEHLASIIFSGALERYPGMRFVLGECGSSWIPYVLTRMDEEYDDQFSHLNFSLKPSDYWRRQGYTTFQHETILADMIHLVGEGNVLWGNDYPHEDGVWPHSRESVQADLGRLDEKVIRKLTCENAGKLYGFIK